MAAYNGSVSARSPESTSTNSELTRALDDALQVRDAAGNWTVASSGIWCCANPDRADQPTQGWKLHVSATVSSSGTVLARSLPVLLAGSSAFKFAATVAAVAGINARQTPRGQSGKFITVYPVSDEEAVWLAGALHEATVGLPGPRILSDRPYVPESLVHYRYGAFVEQRVLSNDGFYAWVIFDPEGNPVEDKRGGQYLPPSWAPCPFPQPKPSPRPADGTAASTGDGGGTSGVLIGGRFLAREAIRHANKGGVYRVVDTETGAEAILKEARPHVASEPDGRDVRDLLRAEFRALERLAPHGVAPRPLALFEQAGNLFLAEELVPGTSLRQWVGDGIKTGGWRRHVPGALEMGARVVELIDTAHRAGLVLRDFNPNNIMVQPDGKLSIIDLELAVPVEASDKSITGHGTPAFSAPEQMAGAQPAVEADYFSLGATLCAVVAGEAPYFLEDVPKTRPWVERLEEWLAVRAQALDIPTPVGRMLLGLLQEQPERRWTVDQARRALAELPASAATSSPVTVPATEVRLGDREWQSAVDGCLNYLLDSMDPSDHDQLWALSAAVGASDPCSLQLGTTGVLGVLTRCYTLTDDQRLPAAIRTAGHWLSKRVAIDEQRPAALYFGTSGIAWSLYEAGRAIGDDELIGSGLALARALPAIEENPDITHGTAGVGLTLLRLGLRSGDTELLDAAGRAADALIGSVEELPSGLNWGTPAAYESLLAGGRYHGFAHGTAGVAYFLLATGLAVGRSDCVELAAQAGETLLANAVVQDGVAQWAAGPEGFDGDARTTAPYWCHGAAGVGTFLSRLHRVTGDDRYLKVADLSALAVLENSWRGVLGQCHGLAGNGEFLVDLAEHASPEQSWRYDAMAHQLARVIFANRAYRDGRIVFPDEQGGLTAAWGDGVSGILAFLLRLRHRSPRMWMVDELLDWSRR